MNNPLLGLILVGGKSRRMQRDKAQIQYRGKTQVQYAWDLIKPFCEEVYISCREDQKETEHLKEFSKIYDLYHNIGPMGGILSAQKSYPTASFLVLACDLPYLDQTTIEQLIRERDPSKVATCFENPEKKWAEPLCTLYEPSSHQLFINALEQDLRCPRKILSNADAKRLTLKIKDGISPLDNINTPEEYQKAVSNLEEPHHAN